MQEIRSFQVQFIFLLLFISLLNLLYFNQEPVVQYNPLVAVVV